MHPHTGGLQHQLKLDHTNPTPEPGGLSIGDSPPGCQGELSPLVLSNLATW
ncbi:TetR/AcrR family transcriptional regulator, partial [Mycolicibacterium smegmatis]